MYIAVHREAPTARVSKRVGQRHECFAANTKGVRLAAAGMEALARHNQVDRVIQASRGQDRANTRDAAEGALKEGCARTYNPRLGFPGKRSGR